MRRKAGQFAVRGLACVALATAGLAAPERARGADVAARSTLLPPLRLDALAQTTGAAPDPAPGTDWDTHTRYVVPVLMSAVVPGTGEMVTGHFWRGLPLLAADVATWFGYAHYREEGRDWRAQYEQYADTHWKYDKWNQELEAYYGPTQPDPKLQWYDPTEPDSCTCLFISKEEDRQHYYENIGKYRFFWMGWDDWSYNTADPKNSDSQEHRRVYSDMRIESNDNFDHATSLVVVAMATRLVSVVQTVFLVRSDLRAERLVFEPRALPGPGTGFALTYHY